MHNQLSTVLILFTIVILSSGWIRSHRSYFNDLNYIDSEITKKCSFYQCLLSSSHKTISLVEDYSYSNNQDHQVISKDLNINKLKQLVVKVDGVYRVYKALSNEKINFYGIYFIYLHPSKKATGFSYQYKHQDQKFHAQDFPHIFIKLRKNHNILNTFSSLKQLRLAVQIKLSPSFKKLTHQHNPSSINWHSIDQGIAFIPTGVNRPEIPLWIRSDTNILFDKGKLSFFDMHVANFDYFSL